MGIFPVRNLNLIAVHLCIAAGVVVLPEGRRTLTTEDLLKRDTIDSHSPSISPDEQMVAFVRRRPKLSQTRSPYTDFGDRADVWIAPVAGGTPVNLTDGETDKSEFWGPIWSPNGERLAMFSTRGGKGVSLWVWERATRKLTKLTDCDIFEYRKPLWVDNQQLVVILGPEGKLPWSHIRRVSGALEREVWTQAFDGQKAASVIDSGIPPRDLTRDPQYRIVLVDTKTGKTRQLAIAPIGSEIKLAPNARHVAVIKQVSLMPPDPTILLRGISEPGNYLVDVIDLSGNHLFSYKDDGRPILPGSFRWSPDSRSFAFLTRKIDKNTDSLNAFRGTLDGTIRQILKADRGTAKGLVWAGVDRLLVSVEREAKLDGKPKTRLDWRLVSASGALRNLSEKLESVPGNLVSVSTDGQSFVGVAGGNLWRLDLASGDWTNLTSRFDHNISGIVWTGTDALPLSRVVPASLVVSVAQGNLTDYYRINIASGAGVKIPKPSDHAELIDYGEKSDVAVFVADESSGTYLTLVRGEERHTVVETNTFLRDIVPGEVRKIAYPSLDGEELKGWLVLPANYEAGKRYPLVTDVYAGDRMTDTQPTGSRINELPYLGRGQLLAARGYAVLFPSMPLPPRLENGGAPSDPYLELTKGVLPAVDKAIEMGIADPKRLGVMGWSYGGYSTYGIITQTRRFQAAFAGAGLSDLISSYGTFTTVERYDDHPEEGIGRRSWSETYAGMGNPPWKDLSRYIRNSPIFYVERVQTPVLIITGDRDGSVPLEQSEEFFNALYRQGKRARFIRYWGEAHAIGLSVENERDFFRQIFAWLDEFCDISRDVSGNLIFDGDRVKSRNGAPVLTPEDFARFDEVQLKWHAGLSLSKQ